MQDALGSVQSVVVFGGRSEIALATVRKLVAGRTRTVLLAVRDPSTMTATVDELTSLGATKVETVAFDAHESGVHDAVVDEVFDRGGEVDLAILAFGVLGDNEEALLHSDVAVDIATTNYVGMVSVAVPLARRLREQGHGTIVALSSVAGERARKANFVYGSSKAGMDAFFQGLGDTLVGTGVRVLVVRPGFVHTKMTAGMDAAPLATTPEAVADATVRALGRRSEVVWVPPALRYAMAVVRHLPRPVFRKLPL